MTGTQLALGITAAAIITGLTIQAVRAAKKSGEYIVQVMPVKDGWTWKITKKGSSDDEVVADSRTVSPPGVFATRLEATGNGRKYARDKLGAKDIG